MLSRAETLEQLARLCRREGAVPPAIHVTGTPELVRARPGHFMPESLIDSQFTALEPPDDALAVDADQPIDCIVSIILQNLALPIK